MLRRLIASVVFSGFLIVIPGSEFYSALAASGEVKTREASISTRLGSLVGVEAVNPAHLFSHLEAVGPLGRDGNRQFDPEYAYDAIFNTVTAASAERRDMDLSLAALEILTESEDHSQAILDHLSNYLYSSDDHFSFDPELQSRRMRLLADWKNAAKHFNSDNNAGALQELQELKAMLIKMRPVAVVADASSPIESENSLRKPLVLSGGTAEWHFEAQRRNVNRLIELLGGPSDLADERELANFARQAMWEGLRSPTKPPNREGAAKLGAKFSAAELDSVLTSKKRDGLMRRTIELFLEFHQLPAYVYEIFHTGLDLLSKIPSRSHDDSLAWLTIKLHDMSILQYAVMQRFNFHEAEISTAEINSKGPEQAYIRSGRWAGVRYALYSLYNPKRIMVLRWLNGIDTKQRTPIEVARLLGVTQENVLRYIQTTALAELRHGKFGPFLRPFSIGDGYLRETFPDLRPKTQEQKARTAFDAQYRSGKTVGRPSMLQTKLLGARIAVLVKYPRRSPDVVEGYVVGMAGGRYAVSREPLNKKGQQLVQAKYILAIRQLDHAYGNPVAFPKQNHPELVGQRVLIASWSPREGPRLVAGYIAEIKGAQYKVAPIRYGPGREFVYLENILAIWMVPDEAVNGGSAKSDAGAVVSDVQNQI